MSIAVSVWLSVLGACSPPGARATLPHDDAAARLLGPNGAVLATSAPIAGREMSIAVTGADASVWTTFLHSTTGAQVGACSPKGCTDLDAPVVKLGRVKTDAVGYAEVVVDLTAGDVGDTLYLQALTTVNGVKELSNVAAVDVRANAVPSAPTFAFSPAAPTDADTVNALLLDASVDPDGDPVTYTYTWTSGAQVVDGPVLDASLTAAGEVWDLSIVPYDGYDDGVAAIGQVTIGEVPPVPHNVLVILFDDVGADKIGLYGIGSEVAQTPVIDGLAAEGVVFSRAYAHPLCSPTRAAILTGRHGFRHGVGAPLAADSTFVLSDAEVTLPEMLDAGTDNAYAHSYVGKWHLGTLTDNFFGHPNQHGYDWYSGSMLGVGPITYTLDGEPQSHYDWERVENGSVARTTLYVDSSHVDDAIAQIDTMPEPWFLMLAVSNGHAPFHDPPVDLYSGPAVGDTTEENQYHWMVEATDTEIGRLLGAIPADVYARTTVMVTADNGTKETVLSPEFDPLHGKGSLYEGGVHVPLIVSGAAVAEPGRQVDALVHLVDLFPTVAAIAGAELDPEVVLDGVSFLPYLADPDHPPVRETVYSERFSPSGAGPYDLYEQMVRDSRWKLVRIDGVDELYDLQGQDVEGEDLLADGLLTQIEEDAYDNLVAQLP